MVDLGEFGSAVVDRDLEAAALKLERGSEPAETGADHDRPAACHMGIIHSQVGQAIWDR